MGLILYRKIREQISDFGTKPTKDVGRILNFVQDAGVSEKEVMPTVQKIYIKLYQEIRGGNLNQARQSWVVASGSSFEDFIRNLVNIYLNKEGILAIKGDRLKNNPKAREIVNFLTLKANRRCTQTTTGVWPDSDIVVLAREKSGRLKVFALLNCKTSDHSRNDAVLFWALALRDTGIKYCLVTQDLDKRFVKGHSSSEISGLRRKAEAYLDRIYTTHPSTDGCTQVIKLDFSTDSGVAPMLNDLRVWRQAIIPDFSSEPINLMFLG